MTLSTTTLPHECADVTASLRPAVAYLVDVELTTCRRELLDEFTRWRLGVMMIARRRVIDDWFGGFRLVANVQLLDDCEVPS